MRSLCVNIAGNAYCACIMRLLLSCLLVKSFGSLSPAALVQTSAPSSV